MMKAFARAYAARSWVVELVVLVGTGFFSWYYYGLTPVVTLLIGIGIGVSATDDDIMTVGKRFDVINPGD